MPDLKIEEEIIKRFFWKHRQHRYLFLSTCKDRSRLGRQLHDPEAMFDSRYYTKFGRRTYLRLPEMCREAGIGHEVYIISADSDWDGKLFPTYDIMGKAMGHWCDTIGYCPKSKVGFFVWHEIFATYVLQRP